MPNHTETADPVDGEMVSSVGQICPDVYLLRGIRIHNKSDKLHLILCLNCVGTAHRRVRMSCFKA